MSDRKNKKSTQVLPVSLAKGVGKIKKVGLREIWKHEASDFTKWLQENPDVIGDIIGFQLFNVEREQSTGNFNVDLRAETSSGDQVIIENQLEKSNHDHLGKIITYLTAFDAKVAIWICSEPRSEHMTAMAWLNESTDCQFFLVKVEGIQIGDSQPAPLLTLMVGPSDLSKSIGTVKREISEKQQLRYAFWEQLLKKSKEKHKLFSAISPSNSTWVGAGSGKSGISYTFWLTNEEVKIILYIDRGKGSDEENLGIFHQLELHKTDIETVFGADLEWLDKPENRACQVKRICSKQGLDTPEEEWPAIIETATDEMVRFESAFKPWISRLKV